MITFTTMGEQDTGVVADTDQAAGQCDTSGWAIVPRVISLYATLVTQLVTQAWKATRAPILGCRPDKVKHGRGDRI